jgi:small subunit ribosomal protein S21
MDFSAPFRYPLGLRSGYFQLIGIRMVKLTVRERESIQEAVRRFRQLIERSGIKKEMRRREFFEKPSETRRRARLRAERRTKRNRLLGV